jgi:3-hydroxy-D-aspartate aldolase
MSKTNNTRAICDAGLKAHSIDSGPPIVCDARSVEYVASSDEHGVLHDPENVLRLGDKLQLIPGHCDPTVNMHNWYIGIRKNRVEQIWPVSARGMLT